MEDDMSQTILSTMNSLVNDSLINKASAVFGEPASGVGTALRMAGPALLAGIMKKGASPGGIADLFSTITGPGIDENIVTKATGLLGNSKSLNQMVSTGDSMVSGIFGNKVDGIGNALSQVAGVKPASALKMLAFAAPLLGGVMKSFVAKRGLNAAGLGSLLAQERDSIVGAGLDPRLTSAMGIGDLRQTVDSFSTAAGRHAESTVAAASDFARQTYSHAEPVRRRTSWLPWAVGAAAVALGLILLTNVFNPRTEQPEALAINVYFDRDQATIDNEDRRAIAAAAASVQANGGAVTVTPVAATSEASDQQLATQRAAAIRDALVSEGVANERILLRPAQAARSGQPPAEAQRVEIALAPSADDRSRN
jgi:outer membrane protein OmpA-like peptidoglycan-associated protein